MMLVALVVLFAIEVGALVLAVRYFEDHIVVVGWSHISRIVVQELLGAGQRVAVVTGDRESLTQIRDLAPRTQLFITLGDPTQEKSIDRAGIRRARTSVLCAEDDTHNLIMSLMIKDLNPRIRVIVSVAREELKRTLTNAGVTYVTSPFEMSGRLVASAAFEPEIAIFIDDITTAATGGYDLQQYTITADCGMAGKSVGHFIDKMNELNASLLVALGVYDGKDWDIKPHPSRDLLLREKDIVITLGNSVQNDVVRSYLGVSQGR